MGEPRLYWLSSVVNSLFNTNKLKLGVFGTNCSLGCTATTADGTFETTWPNTLEVARLADAAGMEALVPIARWKGFGGQTDFTSRPSMRSVEPVIQRAPGDTRKAISSAISSGAP